MNVSVLSKFSRATMHIISFLLCHALVQILCISHRWHYSTTIYVVVWSHWTLSDTQNPCVYIPLKQCCDVDFLPVFINCLVGSVCLRFVLHFCLLVVSSSHVRCLVVQIDHINCEQHWVSDTLIENFNKIICNMYTLIKIDFRLNDVLFYKRKRLLYCNYS